MMIEHLSLLGILLPLGSALAAPGTELSGREDGALEPRTDHSVDGTLFCGNFATGSKHQAPGLVDDLRVGGKLADKIWNVWQGTCRRVHCYDTTAIYVCNDESQYVTLRGTEIGDAAHRVFNNCCRTDYTNNKYNAGISGQKFIRNGKVNVVLGYGNCGHPNFVKPSEEGGQGVNGKCVGGDLNPYWDGN